MPCMSASMSRAATDAGDTITEDTGDMDRRLESEKKAKMATTDPVSSHKDCFEKHRLSHDQSLRQRIGCTSSSEKMIRTDSMSLTLFLANWRNWCRLVRMERWSGGKEPGEHALPIRPSSLLTIEFARQLDQVRGGRGRGWRSLVKATRGHNFAALAVRAKESSAEWNGDVGPGGE